MQKITIVILNWNGKEDTEACLKSIQELALKGVSLSLVVVDNASEDGSYQELSRLGIKNLHIIQNSRNYGFAKGNNIGISYAIEKGVEFIMVLNNDTILDKNILVSMVDYMNKNPEVGAVSPKIYFAKGYEFHKERYKASELGKVIWYAGGEFDWKNIYGTNYGVDKVDRGQFTKSRETDFATGACSLFRVKALKEVGLFDEKYFMYLEDVDLSLRLKKKGWKVIYFGDAYLWHKVAASSGIGSALNDYFITRNRLLFGFKYAPARAKIALLKEGVKLVFIGRKWQKRGVIDFFFRKFGKGSWQDIKK